MRPKDINFDQLSDDAFVRASDLVRNPHRPGVAAPLPFSNPTLWRLVARKAFPQPHRLSAGVTAWNVGEVRAWLRSSCADTSQGQKRTAPGAMQKARSTRGRDKFVARAQGAA